MLPRAVAHIHWATAHLQHITGACLSSTHHKGSPKVHMIVPYTAAEGTGRESVEDV